MRANANAQGARQRAAHASPAAYSPLVWHDARHGSTTQADDISGNGHHATGGGGVGWSATGWDATRPAFVFDGATHYLDYSGGAAFAEAQGSHTIMWRQKSRTTVGTILSTLGAPSTGVFQNRSQYYDGATFAFAAPQGAGVIAYVLDGSSEIRAYTLSGSDMVAMGGSPAGPLSGALAFNGSTRLGGYFGGGQLIGDTIPELFVIPDALSLAHIQRLATGLLRRWP